MGFFSFQNDELHAEEVAFSRLAEEFGTPLYVYSQEAFLEPLRILKKTLSSMPHLICFAMKANSNLSILAKLVENGAGMDLVSGGELFRAQQVQTPGERIVFSGVGKTEKEIEQGLRYGNQGIYSFNVESTEELALIESTAARMQKPARVALRFNPDVDAKTHPYIATGLKKDKFGLQKNEIFELFRKYQSSPWVLFKGLSIHIGSQILKSSPFEEAFSKTRQLIQTLEKKTKEKIEFVDLGGGLGITYKNEKPLSLEKYCNLIKKHFGTGSGLGRPLKVIIEPGRTLVGNAGVLLTRVLYRKERGKKDFLIVDAGMNDLMRPALYESFHAVLPVQKSKNKGRKVKTEVVGPVCESSCFLAKDRSLPKTLAHGDLLAIFSAGAYGWTMASNYNSRPRPAEVLVRGREVRLIRRRESYEDLIRGEQL